MSVPTGQSKIKHLKQVSSLQDRISTNSRGLSPNESEKTSPAFAVRVESTRKASQDGVSFLSATNTIGNYPDTGESGDAYNAESFVNY